MAKEQKSTKERFPEAITAYVNTLPPHRAISLSGIQFVRALFLLAFIVAGVNLNQSKFMFPDVCVSIFTVKVLKKYE